MRSLFQAKHTKEELGLDARQCFLQFESRGIIEQSEAIWDEGTVVYAVTLHHQQRPILRPRLRDELLQIGA